MSQGMTAVQDRRYEVSERRVNDVLVHLANALLMLYAISIYIWSSNATMYIYSNLLCLATLAVMLLVVVPRQGITITKPLGYLLAFGAFCIASILWAEEPSRSITVAFKTLPLLIIFAIVLNNYLECINNGKEFLFSCIYISGIALALYTIWIQGGFGAYLSQMGMGNRLGGEVANENVVGMGTAFSLLIAFYLVLFRHRFAHLAVMALCGLVAFGTGSNKALIIMLLGCLLLLVFYAYTNGTVMSLIKALVLLICVGMGVLALLQLPMFETINQRFNEMINTFLGTGKTNASTVERIGLTKAGLNQFFETPLLGIGIGNSGIITQRVVAGFDSYLHNNYVELLACVGVLGTFLFYMSVLVSLFKMLVNIKSASSSAILVVVLILAWLFIQVGYVSYAEKTTYIYIVLIGMYAWPIKNKREVQINAR